MSTPTVIDTLQKAKEHIQTHGWIQGQYSNADGVCLFGALREVSGTRDREAAALRLLRNLLPPRYYRSLVQWNDTKSRRKSQVIALLDKAIAKAEAQQPSQP